MAVFSNVKVREDAWGYELGFAVGFLVISIIGMSVCAAAVAEIPKCKYGTVNCYFFVQVCGESYFNMNKVNPYTCAWISKQRAVEGSSDSGVEQLALPLVASIFSLVPGIALVASTIIRNERCLLGMLEAGKSFIVFSCLLLVISVVSVNYHTFDCRWFPNEIHGNADECNGGYVKLIVGVSLIFVCQSLLLGGIIVFGEMERRRVRSDGVESFGPGDIGSFQTDAVQMNVRVGGP